MLLLFCSILLPMLLEMFTPQNLLIYCNHVFLGGPADCFYTFKVFSFFAKSTAAWSHFW